VRPFVGRPTIHAGRHLAEQWRLGLYEPAQRMIGQYLIGTSWDEAGLLAPI